MKRTAPQLDANPLVRMGLDHIDQGITVFDSNLKMVTWNRQFLKLLRFPEHLAYEGADFESFIRFNAEKGEYGPGDVNAQVDERVSVAREFLAHKFERQAPDGRILRVVGTPLPAGGFVTVYTDVTAEKTRNEELERRMRERTKQLRLSESRLNLIADEVPAGIAHVDRHMRILYANRRFARAYGMKPDDMTGKACSEILHPDTLRCSSRFFEQARRGAVVDFETRIALPDGRTKDVRTFLRPELPSDGNVIGFYILSVDMTHQKAANEALLQSQKMDALGRLSSGISHDFNNLLAIILGNLVPLQDQIADDVLRQEYLDPAISAARRGSGLTRRLLSLARTEPVDPQPVAVDAPISDLVKLLRSSMPKTVEIEYTAQPGLPLAMVDEAQLEMALLNLAVNARDAVAGSGLISLTVDTHYLSQAEAERHKLASGDYLRIRVSDNGIGIASDLRERVFEPFFTSKHEGGGTGLGLAMVFGFVKQSNGTIRVESEEGEGTTFTMLLPAHRHSPPPLPADTAGKAHGTEHPAPPPALVLLVEDEDEVRRVVRRQLIELGYPLIEAENASDALDLLNSVTEIGLVLSDISMPGRMDGLALARHVRDTAPDTGVVLMSGQSGWAETAENEIGCGFVAKPLDPRELAQALGAARSRAGTVVKPQ